MNKKVYNHLKQFCKKEGVIFDDGDILEILQECGKQLHSEVVDYKGHWDEIFKVVEIDEMLIGYYDAKTTGDLTSYECGWEFDPESCCEVEEYTETIVITSYKPLK